MNKWMTAFSCFALNAFCYGANVYWVSPTGTASWAAAESDTPLSGTACTDLETANTSVVAGDTVYLRGGTYGVPIYLNGKSGTSGNRITFAAHTGETPDIQNTTDIRATYAYGIRVFNNSDYITIRGITVTAQIPSSGNGVRPLAVNDGCDYLEIDSCTFDGSAITGEQSGSGTLFAPQVTANGGDGPDHGWIHHSVFHSMGQIGTNGDDRGGVLQIGVSTDTAANESPDNWTIENNQIYWGAHHTLEVYGQYNVVRNNRMWNEAWIDNPNDPLAVGQKEPDPGPVTGKYGNRTLQIEGPNEFMSATTISATASGNTINDSANGLGIFSVDDMIRITGFTESANTGIAIVTAASASQLTLNGDITLVDEAAGDAVSLGRVTSQHERYNLIEDNRLTGMGPPSDDDGEGMLSISSGNNLIRYNTISGSVGRGVYFKQGEQSQNNVLYNNTILSVGDRPTNRTGIAQAAIELSSFLASGVGNEIINNLIYDGVTEAIARTGSGNDVDDASTVVRGNWNGAKDGDGNYDLDATDPLFIDATIPTDRSSQSQPNMNLQAASGAINNGSYLTQANGSGASSVTLVVDNAMFFQDGTWGSSLVTMSADTIAIGTVGNTVDISSINYSTNTITLASAMTWNDNDNIWLYSKSDGEVVLYGSAPDQGAFEYLEVPSILRKSRAVSSRQSLITIP